MAGNLLFYYFGDDEAYFRILSGEFKKYTRLSLSFKRIFEKDEKKIQSLFLKVFTNRPVCVFIDFSKHSQDYLHLARILSRTSLEQKLVTVGLVDYLSPPEILMESIATGVNLTHIKSAETYDVVFSTTKLIAPNEIGEHGFATASLKEDWEAGIPVKVGYVHPEGVHIETDFALSAGDRIKLRHQWTEKKIVPSKEMFVLDVSTENLFYHFKFAADLEFLFVDEFLAPEGMEPERIEEKKNERDDQILFYKKQLSKWLDDNESRSLEKKAKVLVVDRNFHFYNNQPRTDKHAYTIRCLPALEDIQMELGRLRPQVIAFALDREEETEPRNTKEKLAKLLAALKENSAQEEPFLIVFNCQLSSKEMQESFEYSHIMAIESDLSVELLVKMADIFDRKLQATLVKNKRVQKHERKVFLTKTNAASLAEITVPLKILKLSETDMIFTSEAALTPNTNLRLSRPADLFIHVCPGKNKGEYHGLIHGIGEGQKKELRKFVNTVFFRDHDAQVNAESEEFRKLNEAKLLEKVEALKAALSAEETKNETPEDSEA